MSTPAPKRRGRPPAGGREAILAATLELLREQGIGPLTTREVARVARVSEASVFYHYRDRVGLLRAAFEAGLRPLQALNEEGAIAGPDRVEVLTRFAVTLERFLDSALPIITAAQSEVPLRDALAAYMTERELGPHRGVRALARYFTEEQDAGRVRRDVDAAAVALAFVGTCYLRAAQRQMPGHAAMLPDVEQVITALDAMLEPVKA